MSGDTEQSSWDSIFDGGADILGSAWDWLNTEQGATAAASVLGGGLASFFGADRPDPTGYQGGIPELTYNRQKLDIPVDPNRRPGSMGRRYFTDGAYTETTASPQGIATVPTSPTPDNPDNDDVTTVDTLAYAGGGIAGVDGKKARYLRGDTDGMADEIATEIDGQDPAALSHGEFVIPADIVSFLGEGNSEAGAAKMQKFFDQVRMQAKGSKEQIKEVNSDQLMAGLLR